MEDNKHISKIDLKLLKENIVLKAKLKAIREIVNNQAPNSLIRSMAMKQMDDVEKNAEVIALEVIARLEEIDKELGFVRALREVDENIKI